MRAMDSRRQAWLDADAAVCAVGAALAYAAIRLFLSGGPSGALTAPGSFAFGVSVCASVLVFGVACALVVAFTHIAPEAPLVDDSRVGSWNRSGSVLLVGACIFAVAQPLLGVAPWLAAALVGALGGFGVMLVVMSWGVLFARDEPLHALAVSAVALAIGQVVYACVSLSRDSGMHYTFVIVLGAVAHFLFAARFLKVTSPADSGAGIDYSTGFVGVRSQVVVAVKMLWMPLVGAALMVFIFGLTWDPVVSGESRFDVLEHLGMLRLVGELLGAGVVLVFSVCGGGVSRLRMMHGTLLPAAVAVILALPVIGVEESSVASAIFQILQSAGFVIIQLSVWSAMTATACSVRLHPAVVYSASISVFGLAGLLGIVAIHVVGLGGKDLCVVLLAVYMALIAASFALETRVEQTARIEDEVRPEDFIRRRCEELRESCGISPREVEVLFYLGRGYSHAYIARKLFLSENTVRTHVRHIYAKLGVGNREELLDLIDGVDERG